MPTNNDPRKSVRQGQGKGDLQASLEGVKDGATRAALIAIVEYLTKQLRSGIVSDGPAFVRSLSTSLGGEFKVKLFEGTIRTRDNTNLTDVTELIVPGVIFGVFGWAQYNATGVWEPLTYGAATTNSNRIYIYTNHSERKVRLRNNDTTHANDYRIVVFYRDVAP